MAEADLLNDLLTSNPNEPASKGVVLLLRAEMKSEFRTVRSEMREMRADIAELKADVAVLKADVATLKEDVATLKTDVAELKSSLDLVAQQVAILINLATAAQRH